MRSSPPGHSLVLRHCRWRGDVDGVRDLAIVRGVVSDIGEPSLPGTDGIDLEGRWLMPGLVNAHDHLDLSTLPPSGSPPYPNVYAWSEAVAAGTASAAALSVPVPDRLFLGGLRNLLSGATAVAHHGPDHRSLGRPDFPVRVLRRYDFAHSPGLTPKLRLTYRTTDRRIPWFVHAGEGTDARSRSELSALADANVLRQNTVVVHGIAFGAADAEAMAAAHACLVWCPEANRRLYGATADVAAMRAAGVRVGLGSDSPAAGARDALSNLAAARREAVLSDDELIDMATRGSGEVARLPVGDFAAGAPADFVAVDSLERWLAGDRAAIALVVVAGRVVWGLPHLVEAALARSTPVRLDGEDRRLEVETARRARALFKALRAALRAVPWSGAVAFEA